MADPGSIPRDDPVAYFLTWTTYGTWLPGDERGWVKEAEGFQLPDYKVKHEANRKLTERPCILDEQQRRIVEETIERHCAIRGWTLLAVACRTNHVHAVVAGNEHPKKMMDQFKAWCTRKLKELEAIASSNSQRKNWWTEGGSKRYLNDMASVDALVEYVAECQ